MVFEYWWPDDYLIAHETCRFLEASGAQVCGPVPSIDDVVRMLREEQRLDGALVRTELRDGLSGPVVSELARRGIPFVLTANVSGGLLPSDYPRSALLLTPTGLVRSRKGVREPMPEQGQVAGAEKRAKAPL